MIRLESSAPKYWCVCCLNGWIRGHKGLWGAMKVQSLYDSIYPPKKQRQLKKVNNINIYSVFGHIKWNGIWLHFRWAFFLRPGVCSLHLFLILPIHFKMLPCSRHRVSKVSITATSHRVSTITFSVFLTMWRASHLHLCCSFLRIWTYCFLIMSKPEIICSCLLRRNAQPGTHWNVRLQHLARQVTWFLFIYSIK